MVLSRDTRRDIVQRDPMRLVGYCARRFHGYWDLSDMLSAGLVGYAKAVKRWKPGPVPFDAFAIPLVRHAMTDAYRSWNGRRRERRPVMVSADTGGTGVALDVRDRLVERCTPEDRLLAEETARRRSWALREALMSLPVPHGKKPGRNLWALMMRRLYGAQTFAALGRRRLTTESNAHRLYVEGLGLVKARMEELLA